MSVTNGSTKILGTVLILHNGPGLIDDHLQLIQSWGLNVKTYRSCSELLSSKPPEGPACLMTCINGNEKYDLRCCEELKLGGLYVPVIFLVKNADLRLVVQAMRAGAEDVIGLPAEENQMMAVVFKALDKSKRLAGISDDCLTINRRAALLTAREREIVNLVVAGKLNKEIADHLGLALVTVKVHRGHAMQKLGARTPADLARIAQTAGIWVSTEAPLPARKATRNQTTVS